MRFMKRIAAIMLSVVMVLGMSSAVSATTTSANSGTSATTKGKITITNAIPGQTYTIYRILDLESYNATTSSYAYKVATGWDKFVDAPGAGSDYLVKDATSDYVTWKTGVSTTDDTVIAKFAKKALAYAKDTNNSVIAAGSEKATTTTVVFDDLDLGYYLVESSTGALCSLTTTNNQVSIQEKNGVPSVEKQVKQAADTYADSNTASIGTTVEFKTTITAQSGAVNYVLHDKMSEGLTFNADSVAVKWTNSAGTEKTPAPATTEDYSVKTDDLETETPCTFHIVFTEAFCDKLKTDDKIIITYSATLNENAVIGGTGNPNETWLGYGNHNTTNHDKTTTKTFELPVFKYTKKTDGTKKGLAGAIFKLSTSADQTDSSKIVKMERITGGTEDTYCVKNTTGTVEEITTTDTSGSAGKFTIKGLDAGTYYLHETKQPDGYNKLTAPVTVVIAEDGTITVNNAALPTPGLVEIENKTGSILPSTGGRGTTILYVLGALLVLGSSVVLITKRRMKE